MSATDCTILTLNVFHDLPTYRHLRRRCELIAAAIAARRPDIVALQEVLRSAASGDLGAAIRDGANQRLGERMYRLDYAMADGAGEGEFSFDEGVALLSRLEPDGPAETLKYQAQVVMAAEVGGQRYRLPDDRVAMRRRFRLKDGARLAFCVTHLTDRPEAIDGVAVRVRQAVELARWAAAGAIDGCATIVAGDLNDLADSAALAALKRAGFIDLHAVFGSGPGYTNDRDDIDLSAERATHNQRIDYLLMRPAEGGGAAVREVGLFADRPNREADGTWLWPSDHIGVVATLRL